MPETLPSKGSSLQMGTRVPVPHYTLRSPNSFLGTSLHDLNTVDSRTGEIEGIGDDERGGAAENSLDNDEGSTSVECMNESYRNSLQLQTVSVDADRSNLEDDGHPVGPYDMFSIEDVTPLENARARFLQIIVDHFLSGHVIEVAETEIGYVSYSEQEKMEKRKLKEVQYEGDPRFALPLMYVANVYETLVTDVNVRLASLTGMRDKTIGVALEAAGGLYRKLAKKYPRKGSCTYKRRELATSLETRTRFPELVIQEEKRVRFVVINGLDIVEKPNSMSIDDADWFMRLTGRSEVAVSARDYKFYSPRHKYRRVSPNLPGFPTFPEADNSSAMTSGQEFCSLNEQQTLSKHHMHPLSHPPEFHPTQQNHHQSIHEGQHLAHFSHNELPAQLLISQQMACLHPLSGHMVGGRLHATPSSPAKFCDECGAAYYRRSSKFCSNCGTKRLGI